tara:strand:- start:2681 stop:3553 length:873 start_codon:yes stop_codon:yes gene_type:complete
MPVIYDNGITDYGVVDHPQQLWDGGAASGIYKFNTPDGGVQDGYYLRCEGESQGGDQGWVLIGRYASDASLTVRDTMSSVRGLDDVSTSGTSYWSADWGTFKPKEIRFLGHTNASNILGNRTIDWIYRVVNINQEGDQRYHPQLWEWMLNANHGDNHHGTNNQGSDQISFRTTAIEGGKQGVNVAGARDGRGRWDNRALTSIRISDNSVSNYMKPGGFSKPQSQMWYYHHAQDAKWAVSATDNDCGQDTDSSALFGWDDNNRGFYDEGTGNRDQNSTHRPYSSCVLVFMR